MNFQQFRDINNGKGVDVDNYPNDNKFQCMDLMHKYIVDVLGLSLSVLAAPTAYQAYVNGDSHFDKIPNTPTGVPQNGDIVFWDTTVGPAGHVAIFVDGDVNKFNSFDQNWPVGSLCHIQAHNDNYKGVAGWLRIKPDLQAQLNQAIADRDKNWNLYQADEAKIKTLQGTIDSLSKKLSDIKTIIG